jgi:outer membrane protein assembly factor BamB
VDWLISPSAQGCYAYDPRTGRELWHVRYSGFSAVPRAVVREGLAYVVTDFAKPHVLAVRLGGKGDITNTHLAWKHTRNGPSTPSPIVVGDLLYTVSDRGILSCLDAIRGDLVWRERLGGRFCASPVASGGRVYFCDREGRTTVIQSGRTFQRLALNELEQGLMASPAAAGDALYLRTRDYLYCIDARAK